MLLGASKDGLVSGGELTCVSLAHTFVFIYILSVANFSNVLLCFIINRVDVLCVHLQKK